MSTALIQSSGNFSNLVQAMAFAAQLAEHYARLAGPRVPNRRPKSCIFWDYIRFAHIIYDSDTGNCTFFQYRLQFMKSGVNA